MARPESKAVAFLVVSTEETQNRLGMCEARGLHLSAKARKFVALYIQKNQMNEYRYKEPHFL